MADELSLYEQAADALTRAIMTRSGREQSILLDEAARLNDLALKAERQKAERTAKPCPVENIFG